MGLLCGQKWICSCATLNPTQQLSCVNNSQSFTRYRNPVWTDLCQLITRVCQNTFKHTCTQWLMHAPHTSTTDYVVLSSPHFIRLCLWCGVPWSLRNTVLGNETGWICALAPLKRLAIDPPCVSWCLPASFCCLQSLTPSPPPRSNIYPSFRQHPF